MLNIAIVDDLADDRAHMASDVQAYLAAHRVSANCRTFSDAAAFLRAHAAEPFQLAFFDICMKDMDGIALSRSLRATDAEMLIVFVSTSREYAFDAFPLHPFDYLVKPYAAARMIGVLDEAMRALSASEAEAEIRVPHACVKLAHSRISAVVAHGHTVDLVLTDGRRLHTVMTFTEISKALDGDRRFMDLNRGVIINMDDVLTVERDSMRMKTGEAYPIRMRGRGALVSQFTQYQIDRMRKEMRP